MAPDDRAVAAVQPPPAVLAVEQHATPTQDFQTQPDPLAPHELPAPAAPALPADPLAPPQGPELPAGPGAADQLASPEAAPDPATGADGAIIVTGRSRRGDPMVEVNAQSFEATQAVDEALVAPVARAYQQSVPRPIRKGVRNFLNNLREPVVAANFLLQLKPGKAGETLARFAINSTLGVGGLVDLAKHPPMNLPRRRNGFANTLGYYGVKPGPFFYLPLIGPTTLRDLIGNGIDQFAGPLNRVKPFNQRVVIVPLAVLSSLDHRIEFDEELERQRATVDPYAAARKYYLDTRQAEIDALRGRPKVVPPAPEPAVAPSAPEPAVAPSASEPAVVPLAPEPAVVPSASEPAVPIEP